MTKNYSELALELHKKLHGKIESKSKLKISNADELSQVYTPGVGAVSSLLAEHPELASEYTIKHNTVAVISDGSAVLGLGNIGPYGALPVMEGKSMLFSELAGLNSFPIVLDTQDTQKIINTIVHIAPVFAAINLEDIASPHCFKIELELQKRLSIPVVHDDQHATAIAVLAGLINALKVVGKQAANTKVVIFGAGASGNGVAKLLAGFGVADIIALDSKGIISKDRDDLDENKAELAQITNKENVSGNLAIACKNADVIIGLTAGGEILPAHIEAMNSDAIVFGMSNPTPEIMPQTAKAAGAVIVATGRSDFANQINNVLVFPGLFKGLIDHSIRQVTLDIKLKAAQALADVVPNPTAEKIIPSVFEAEVVSAIAQNIR